MTVIQRDSRYVPNLQQFMVDCEANYVRLSRLLPSLHQQDDWCFGLSASLQSSQLMVEVVERSRYTTTLRLHQTGQPNRWTGTANVIVRLYHDAQMAEVLSFQAHPKPAPVYSYPNPDMYHRDEKAQLNQLLGEWLDFCLRFGFVEKL